MLKPEQVPKECLVAYQRAFKAGGGPADGIAAAVNAWPGLNHDSQAWRGYGGEVLILPLTEIKKETQPGAFDYWPAEEEGNWGDD